MSATWLNTASAVRLKLAGAGHRSVKFGLVSDGIAFLR